MSSDKIKPILLVTGATGYVGHHILQFVHKTYPSYIVYATHCSKKPKIRSNDALKKINYIQLDLADDKSIKAAVDAMFTNDIIPQIIIHCAAVTSPAFCQKKEDKTMKINCPTFFIDTLLSYYKQESIDKDPLFIFFSTDHVYDGQLSHANTIKHASMYDDDDNDDDTEQKMMNDADNIYNEQSPCYPVNNYGESKLMMEKYLLMHWKNLVILRCSVIYGPENEKKPTFLQFVVNSLSNDKNKEITLFYEKRNFVSIWSVIKTVEYFINQYYINHCNKEYHDIYNCGGITTLSRVQFGEICGKIYGFNVNKINAMNRRDCKQKWAKTAPNPQDLTMSSSKLYQELKDFYTFTPFTELIQQINAQKSIKSV